MVLETRGSGGGGGSAPAIVTRLAVDDVIGVVDPLGLNVGLTVIIYVIAISVIIKAVSVVLIKRESLGS